MSRLQKLKERFQELREGKDALLALIDEVELSEAVYNSNAIENSTLSLPETEKILLDMEVSRHVNLREVFEAKNLAVVSVYVQKHSSVDIMADGILLLHKMLLTTIDERIAGRFRQKGEFVRVGTHIAPPPEQIEPDLQEALRRYRFDDVTHVLEKIALFHLDFETLHPFVDGNGRIGRLLMNYQLLQHGYPPIIIRNKDKKQYYQGLSEFQTTFHTGKFVTFFILAVKESLHKRIAYLEGQKILPLAQYAKLHSKNLSSLLNSAKRQSIPAFREKGVWKIGV